MFPLSTHLVLLINLFGLHFITGFEIDLERERSYPTPVRNSTLLPLLVESLALQKNSPDTSCRINRKYDYIIVGAGAAGSVVAARLSELSCVSVLLIEAGPPPPKLNDIVAFSSSFYFTNLDWQYVTAPQKFAGNGFVNRQIILTSGKGLGGSTLLNHGIHVRGNRKVYDDWAAMGAEGWSYNEVLPYFKKLEDNRNFEFVRNGYHGVGGPISVEKPRYNSETKRPIFKAFNSMGYREVDPNADHETGLYDIQANLRLGQRCSTAKAYLVPADKRTNLDILPNAFVTKVIIRQGRAVGVLFDYEGRTYEVGANREVILSTGAIKTPQLLMLSGVGPELLLRQFNIPVHADLPVGRNFHDHASIKVYFTLKPFIPNILEKFSGEEYVLQYILNRTGPLASVAGVSYAAFLRNDEVTPKIDFPNYSIFFSEISVNRNQQYFNLRPEVYDQVFRPYENRSIIRCNVANLQPKSRGSIQLQSANPYDQPIIDPNFFADPRDVEDLVQGMKACYRIGNSQEMKQVIEGPFRTLYPGCEEYSRNEDAYLRCVIHSVGTTYNHYCGSAKMGSFEDPTTVLDPKLRVKNIKGLRVADASVMPIVTCGNTEVPTVMIGEKAADLIKETINCNYKCPFYG